MPHMACHRDILYDWGESPDLRHSRRRHTAPSGQLSACVERGRTRSWQVLSVKVSVHEVDLLALFWQISAGSSHDDSSKLSMLAYSGASYVWSWALPHPHHWLLSIYKAVVRKTEIHQVSSWEMNFDSHWLEIPYGGRILECVNTVPKHVPIAKLKGMEKRSGIIRLTVGWTSCTCFKQYQCCICKIVVQH